MPRTFDTAARISSAFDSLTCRSGPTTLMVFSPFTLRLQRREQFDIEEASRVRAVVGTSELGHDRDDLRPRAVFLVAGQPFIFGAAEHDASHAADQFRRAVQ